MLTLLAVWLMAAVPSDVLPVPASIVADGIPPVPLALAEKVGRYTDLRSAYFLDWHPTRREMIVLTRFADAAQVHLVAAPMGARRQLTFFADGVRDPSNPSQSASYFPADGDSILLMKDVGGNEQTQFYRYGLKAGTATLLTDGKSRFINPVWTRKGDAFVYGSTQRNGRDVDLYLATLSSAEPLKPLLELSGGGWIPQDFSPDGRHLLLLEYISVTEAALWLVDVVARQKRLLTHRGERPVAHAWALVGTAAVFSADGKGAFITSDRDSEFLRLAWLDVESGKESVLTADLPWGIDGLALSRDGRQLAFTVNEDGFSSLYLMDTKSRRHRRLTGIPEGVISGLSWHSNGRDLGFSLAAARLPPDAFSVDVNSGALTRWTWSETGWLNPSLFAQPERISWKSFDGRIITGLLYRPPARFTGKRPVLVNIHGGPESQARPGFQGLNNYFVEELGMAVVLPNVRGSSGYGKTFVALDDGPLREGAYQDIGALLDWVATDAALDSTRVVVMGASYGGHMTLAVATVFPERIQAAISVVGISSFVTFLETTAEYRRDLRRPEYGDERIPEVRAFMQRIAPMTNAGKIRRPLLVVQGRNDPRVPFGEAEQMVKTVRSNKIPAWYLVASDEGHGFKRKVNADYQLHVTALFLESLR